MTILRVDTISGIGSDGVVLGGDLEFTSQNYVILPKGTSAQEGVLRTTVDVVGAGSTYYDNLVLAMPFNAATGFADVSSRNRNPGVYGNTTISTAQSKYYGSSVGPFSRSSAPYLSIADQSDFEFDSGNFTIECWIYLSNSIQQYEGIISKPGNSDAQGWMIYKEVQNNNIQFLATVGSSSGWQVVLIFGTSSTLSNQWNHYAVVRNGNIFTAYLNGSAVQSQTVSGSIVNNNGPLEIGRYIRFPGNITYGFDGYLQDLRIYKGIAKYTGTFTPPERIAEIGVGFKAGQLRYNTDSNKVELYDGSQWAEVQSSSPNLNGGARAIYFGGFDVNTIQYVSISSLGNALDFGNLTTTNFNGGACASSTRAVCTNGRASLSMEFVTISSTGNASTFGNLSVGRTIIANSMCSSSTRGINSGGQTPGFQNIIDYITIASTGNAVDFGDLTVFRSRIAALASSTRGINIGGYGPSSSIVNNTIDYVTISTTGDAVDFGDSGTSPITQAAPTSNSTRGIFFGGVTTTTPAATNTTQIDYLTIATLGNSQKFGDLSSNRRTSGATSSSTRAICGGGEDNAGVTTNTIEYVTISATGNAIDFGDLTSALFVITATSNGHGGL